MIDHSLVISPLGAVLFHLKLGFWLYAWPMMIGFLTILGYQVLGRVVMMGNTSWPVVFSFASVVSMISLFGWVLMARGMHMIPFYGCGVGLASAMMSRVHAITMPVIAMPGYARLKVRFIRVTWRGDTVGIAQLQQALRARAAAQPPTSAGTGAGTTIDAVRG
jgi:hypothetical protein